MNVINYIKYWLKIVPKWKECTKASCWTGTNAKHRLMNMLSPYMSNDHFKEHLKWMKKRGCNTAHLILLNKNDGECAGYNAADNAKLTKKRIKKLRLAGMAIVPWLVTDDSSAWARQLFADPDKYIKAWEKAGIFDYASYVCLGLEMDEYGSAKDWEKVHNALKRVWKGKIAVHHTSGKYPFASLGNIICDQMEPAKATPKAITASVQKLIAMGKAVVGFEYSRTEDREKAQAALNAGAFGCGNW